MPSTRSLLTRLILLLIAPVSAALAQDQTRLLWGDTHLHTSYSFDAFLNQNDSADPDTAYRWARGLPVIHPYTEARVRIGTPLDFLVVSDHAEGMGVLRAIVNGNQQLGIPQSMDLGNKPANLLSRSKIT